MGDAHLSLDVPSLVEVAQRLSPVLKESVQFARVSKRCAHAQARCTRLAHSLAGFSSPLFATLFPAATALARDCRGGIPRSFHPPPSVTALSLSNVSFFFILDRLPAFHSVLTHLHCSLETQGKWYFSNEIADFSPLDRLTSLSIDHITATLVLPFQRLDTLRITLHPTTLEHVELPQLLAVLGSIAPDAAASITVRFAHLSAFRQFQPYTARFPFIAFVCGEIGQDVPLAAFALTAVQRDILLTDAFDDAELTRVFGQTAIDVSQAQLCCRQFHKEQCDLSAIAATSLTVVGLAECLLVLPTTVRALSLTAVNDVLVVNTAGITRLRLDNARVELESGERVQTMELQWSGELPETAFAGLNVSSALTSLTASVGRVPETGAFPPSLRELHIETLSNTALPTPIAGLPSLTRLSVAAPPSVARLDLSRLTSVAVLDGGCSWVCDFPVNLVRCSVAVYADVSLERFTRLTGLELDVFNSDAAVTLPSSLKALTLKKGFPRTSNVTALALESFRSDFQLSRKEIKQLPRQLQAPNEPLDSGLRTASELVSFVQTMAALVCSL